MNLTHSASGNMHSAFHSESSILLIEEKYNERSLLKKSLIDFGYDVTMHLSSYRNIIAQLESCNPSILILSIKMPSEKLLNDLVEVNKLLPLPIIIFAESDSPTIIQNSIKSGVSAYVAHEIWPQRINSIICVALERFKEVQTLRNELKKVKTQLESRKLVERAKGLLMVQKRINENQAYDSLRKMAMNQGNSLAVVAKNVIDVCELFEAS